MHSDIVAPTSEKTLEASQHLCSAAISSAEKRNIIFTFLMHVKEENSGQDRVKLDERLQWR